MCKYSVPLMLYHHLKFTLLQPIRDFITTVDLRDLNRRPLSRRIGPLPPTFPRCSPLRFLTTLLAALHSLTLTFVGTSHRSAWRDAAGRTASTRIRLHDAEVLIDSSRHSEHIDFPGSHCSFAYLGHSRTAEYSYSRTLV